MVLILGFHHRKVLILSWFFDLARCYLRSETMKDRLLPPRSLRVASSRNRQLGAPASRAALEHVAVMQNAVQHGGDGRHIAQQLAPVLDRPVGGQQRAGALIAAMTVSSRSSAAVSGSLRMPSRR